MNYINSQVMVDAILASTINSNCEKDTEVFLLSLENIASSQMEARSKIINIQPNKSMYCYVFNKYNINLTISIGIIYDIDVNTLYFTITEITILEYIAGYISKKLSICDYICDDCMPAIYIPNI